MSSMSAPYTVAWIRVNETIVNLHSLDAARRKAIYELEVTDRVA